MFPSISLAAAPWLIRQKVTTHCSFFYVYQRPIPRLTAAHRDFLPLAELEKTVKLDSGYARAWYNLGLARNGMGQQQEAITALLQGEAADPNDSAIPCARATIHARLGQRNEALAAATLALQLRSDFTEAMQLIQALSRPSR